MGEPSDEELLRLMFDVYVRHHPASAYASTSYDVGAMQAALRAVYNAGKADAEARIRAEERERVLGILRRRFRLHDAAPGLSYGIFASELESELCAIEEARKA